MPRVTRAAQGWAEDGLSRAWHRVGDELGAWRGQVDERFDRVEQRLDAIEGRLDELSGKLDRHIEHCEGWQARADAKFDRLLGYFERDERSGGRGG